MRILVRFAYKESVGLVRIYSTIHQALKQPRTLRSNWSLRSFRTSARNLTDDEDVESRGIGNVTMSDKPAKFGKKKPQIPRPSSSVLLVSPSNQVLLLHRVKTSSAFPSAHVFPGGNISTFHDGEIPEPDDPKRHEDGRIYRLAAIRETFEESGILLAKNNGFGRLIEVADEAREEGRKAIHENKVRFEDWLARHGGRADVDNLVPFTRWVTPTNVPKRYTTQMYIYFLPLASNADPYRGPTAPPALASSSDPSSEAAVIPDPTSDGGLEHTTARFLPPSKWLEMAQSGEIILFPPQYFLLYLVSKFFQPDSESPSQLGKDRQAFRQFVKTSDPPWGEKVISPVQMMKRSSDGKLVLRLDKAGPELQDKRRGEEEYVVLVNFQKEGPRDVEVHKRKDILAAEKKQKEKL